MEKYRDTNLKPEERAEDLLGRMSIEEKVAQLRSIPSVETDEDGHLCVEKVQQDICYGIGAFQLPAKNFYPEKGTRLINELQKAVMEASKFHIPALIHEECLSGQVAKGATMFPKPIGLAATFHPELVQSIYDVIGRETYARGGSQAFTPVLDLCRDLRFGRTEETFGEDVCLATAMGKAAVRGLQGADFGLGEGHVASTVKHFAGYAQCVGGRNFAPACFGDREFKDEILKVFKDVICDAGPLGVMPSHCEINGIPCHMNEELLTELLRNQWGFEGIVVSDYFDVERLNSFQHVAETKEEAACLALCAGVDMDVPNGESYEKLVQRAVGGDEKLLEWINRAVKRVLTLKFRLNLFENPFRDPKEAVMTVRTEEAIKLAHTAARESIILLKNGANILPFKDGIKKIAVIGPCAHPVHFSYYSTTPNEGVSILDGISEKACRQGIEIFYEKGCGLVKNESSMDTEVDALMMCEPELYTADEEYETIQHAAELAAECDVTIVCVGGSASTSREAIFKNNSSGDNDTLELVGQQKLLLQKIREKAQKMVVICVSGKPLTSTEIYDMPDAMLQCFYAGTETGNAMADILFGDEEPSGRLPVSVPYNVGQLPVYYSQKSTGKFKNYLFAPKGVRYPFGYGLGYTPVTWLDFRMNKEEITAEESIEICVVIKNEGTTKAIEVVQLYIKDLYADVTRPDLELKRFQRVELKPQETKEIMFQISDEDLCYTDSQNVWRSGTGAFAVMVGRNCEDVFVKQFIRR